MGPPASYRVSRVRYYSGVTRLYLDFVYGSFTLCALLFQNSSTILPECHVVIRNPEVQAPRFGLFPVRSPLLGESMFLSFPRATYMFQFTPFPFSALYIHAVVRTHYDAWVPPFGNLRVIRYLLLTAAYRSLSRPSSAPSAKASALCSLLLDQFGCLT